MVLRVRRYGVALVLPGIARCTPRCLATLCLDQTPTWTLRLVHEFCPTAAAACGEQHVPPCLWLYFTAIDSGAPVQHR